ncbi:helix-turn-helix transcriptional regulator [Nocardia sp. CDC159]|uniref:Helix-turn-helix transcriptional regulator n=1 Tax=Nocardia pulmonis TaxID=2951408 RepID=A0A9X2J1Q4_9NOCA|nr:MULTISPECIES: helix-turn-helix domain-containing protein [Nocardia]MCM6777251.1 helix-turn-helix transcriptional regulator [Nocardia pulmonis]MCM6790136.1 helix-turn-helix transcriptional regulator [Nocardia sp. CDC159]
MSSIRNLGTWVREWRNRAELTQAELATMVGIAEETLSAIERDKRPISQSVLRPLLTVLGIDPSLARAFTDMYAGPRRLDHVRPIPQEISALEAISTPACYQEVRTYRIVAANTAARHALPGLEPGLALVEWVLLDPRAREVIGDWEAAAHNFVHSLKITARALMDPEVGESLIRTCSQAPEWDRMWNTEPDEFGPMTLTHIDPVTRIPQPVYLTSCTLQYPRAGWALWIISPVIDPGDVDSHPNVVAWSE